MQKSSDKKYYGRKIGFIYLDKVKESYRVWRSVYIDKNNSLESCRFIEISMLVLSDSKKKKEDIFSL